ncbi:hypothetical protein [Mycoplasma capricolum]|uniref:hypothetical protein n=1 Tax=Mycoplasma capricolum TaxID=2095 RepID=UPI0022F393CE|nr:hypothetical protein [Mycoplasma capricolum]WBX36263.1 hypothetical protein NO343_00045 [Mycoplasma capricolum subsp. capricolum]
MKALSTKEKLKYLIINNWKVNSETNRNFEEWLLKNKNIYKVETNSSMNLQESYLEYHNFNTNFLRTSCILEDFNVEVPKELKGLKFKDIWKLLDSIWTYIQKQEETYQLDELNSIYDYSDNTLIFLFYLHYLYSCINNPSDFISTVISISYNLQRIDYKFYNYVGIHYENKLFNIVGDLFIEKQLSWKELSSLDKICKTVASEEIDKIASSITDKILSNQWYQTFSNLDCIELKPILDKSWDAKIYGIDEKEYNLAIETKGEPDYFDSAKYIQIIGSDPHNWEEIDDLNIVYNFINKLEKEDILEWMQNVIENT